MSTPLGAARRLITEGHRPTLLLSAHPTPFGTRSLLAVAPEATIQLETGAGLPAIPPRLVHEAHGEGVWVGAIAYDAGLDLLGIAPRHPARDPALLAHYHRTYAVHDTATGSWDVLGPDGPTRNVLTAAISGEDPPASLAEPAERTATSGLSRGQFGERARDVQRLISAGEAFEINLAHVIRVPWQSGGWDLFERLVAVAPADHAAYLAGDGVELASVSPEVFLHVRDGRAETRPIKGTRRRGASPEPGSVRVTALCELERTENVMHLVSAVEATIRADVRLPDVLVSCFPGGSITGAPKRRAMELIDRLEEDPRGFYCGAIFAYEPARRSLTASIAIRTATVAGGEARYGAGGAITLLSDPDEEAEETLIKARPFLTATHATLAGWES
jgi:para-aminobenzoate synthetase component 1